jgi:hypothetical protein
LVAVDSVPERISENLSTSRVNRRAPHEEHRSSSVFCELVPEAAAGIKEAVTANNWIARVGRKEGRGCTFSKRKWSRD